jgi:hypothetical protein
MSLIDEMKSDEEVPDDIYLSASINARTPEEVAFRDVLFFHRVTLQDGLDGALTNQAADPSDLARIVDAFNLVGLAALAAVIGRAYAELCRHPEMITSEFDAWARRYMELSYGADGNQPDAVEGHAIRFAKARSAAFSNIAVGAITAAKDTGTDKLLQGMEDLLRRIKEQP